MTDFALKIDDAAIDAAVAPLVERRFEPGDREWRAIVDEHAARQRRMRRRRRLVGWLPWLHRTQTSINYNYSQQWNTIPPEVDLAHGGVVVPLSWRDRGYQARATANKRVRLLFLMEAIAQLKPRTILEVGAGNGVNLCLLAARFPEIHITGLELTEGGVTTARRLTSVAAIDPAICAYSPEPLVDTSPFDRIRVVRGNAAKLPFADASFDLVITVLALEQMEEIRSKALAEIRRVARRHTVMVEPFYEWNASGAQRDFVIANDYFAGRIADLPRFGLEPILATDDMPSKLTSRAGLVVSRVAPAR